MLRRIKAIETTVKRAFLAVLLAGFGLFLFSPAALATDPPDSVAIYDVKIYHHLLEDNDMLAVVPYSIDYGTAPDESVADVFLFRFMDTADTYELGSAAAYGYYNNGYGDGIVSFYFSAEDAPTWGEAYYIRIEESPAYFAAPIHWSFPLSSADYSSYDTQDQNQEMLRNDIINIAQELSTTWGLELTDQADTGTVLSSYGESYFRISVWGIQSMCPELFYTQVTDPDYTERSWDTAFADNLMLTFEDTFLWDFMTGFSGLWGLDDDRETASGIIVLVLVVVGFGIYDWKYQKGTDAWLAVPIMLNFGMLMGWLSPILHAVIAFFHVLVGAMVQLFNRS